MDNVYIQSLILVESVISPLFKLSDSKINAWKQDIENCLTNHSIPRAHTHSATNMITIE
jgi:hypothetical protein